MRAARETYALWGATRFGEVSGKFGTIWEAVTGSTGSPRWEIAPGGATSFLTFASVLL